MDCVTRAPRFSMGIPIFWRRRGDATWSDAVSVNVSRSGVLVRAEESPFMGAEVELIFGLSWHPDQAAQLADLICHGRIVRADASQLNGRVFAATIDSYAFIRQDEARAGVSV